MKIKSIDYYKDGGTAEYHTDQGAFCIDGRIATRTRAVCYVGYPDEGVLASPEQVKALAEELSHIPEENLARVTVEFLTVVRGLL